MAPMTCPLCGDTIGPDDQVIGVGSVVVHAACTRSQATRAPEPRIRDSHDDDCCAVMSPVAVWRQVSVRPRSTTSPPG